MLDRSKLMRELEHVSSRLFSDISGEFDTARAVWQTIEKNQSFVSAVCEAVFQAPLPTWQGDLGQAIVVDPRRISKSTLVAVDGSQIYPDRHQGSSCFLINIGSVILSYGIPDRRVKFCSEPQVFVGEDDAFVQGSLVDFVNCRREELEFDVGIELMNKLKEGSVPDERLLFLVDGSLIFWHLESKDPVVRITFLSRYCASLEALHASQLLCAGYISLSRNKDLVNLIRFAIKSGMFHGPVCESLDHVIDTHIAHFFLAPGTRSVVFKHRAKFCDLYPAQVRPYFFYIHVGSEIARIEVPAWIATNESLVDDIASMILDNSLKGRGYPVALAEAHEQAVVKGPDRDFFYHLIQKVGFDKHRNVLISQKSAKKRSIGF